MSSSVNFFFNSPERTIGFFSIVENLFFAAAVLPDPIEGAIILCRFPLGTGLGADAATTMDCFFEGISVVKVTYLPSTVEKRLSAFAAPLPPGKLLRTPTRVGFVITAALFVDPGFCTNSSVGDMSSTPVWLSAGLRPAVKVTIVPSTVE
jgi:hypothetical protein